MRKIIFGLMILLCAYSGAKSKDDILDHPINQGEVLKTIGNETKEEMIERYKPFLQEFNQVAEKSLQLDEWELNIKKAKEELEKEKSLTPYQKNSLLEALKIQEKTIQTARRAGEIINAVSMFKIKRSNVELYNKQNNIKSTPIDATKK